jgi:hypothetical protein
MHPYLDAINGVFEFSASLFIFSSVHKLVKDKRVAGMRIAQVAWFALWGLWNLVYYYKLTQFLSWAAGLLVATANITWVVLALYYSRRKEEPCPSK